MRERHSPVDAISAALIIADKTDVRRSRVRNTDFMTFDIHDRVNYAVEYSNLHFSDDQKSIVLDLTIDTEISSVLEYFEIFMERMLLSKRAALFFDRNSRCTLTAAIFYKTDKTSRKPADIAIDSRSSQMYGFGENNGGTIS